LNGCIVAWVAALALAGCATGNRVVPGNRITLTIAGQPVTIENPKNTTLKGASLEYHSGTNSITLRIDELVSTNDPEVIGEAYAGQVAVTRAQFEGVGQIADKLIQATKQAGAATATGGASELISQRGEGVSREGAKGAKVLADGHKEGVAAATPYRLPVDVTPERRREIEEFAGKAGR
jgi:hypothetical protein